MLLQVLFLVLDKPELLKPVLKTFLDCGVKGATVLESTGMGRMLSHEVPIFASLRTIFENAGHHNNTIFAVIKDDAKVDRLVEALKAVLGDLEAPGTGIIFTLPVTRVIGLAGDIRA
ncbi:MAG: hypothetical protein GX493_08895 [Firmicutes bacterium]|nr:hypothetical protein [Bacillota bacterium]